MHIKYFIVDLQTLIQLKDYVCSCITDMVDQHIEREAMKSLTQLMCEFDTMSDKGEVLDALYKSIMVGMSKPSIACVESRICDFRGMIEGTFRQR